mmetsp:Transcript_43875/g.72476  ORF Transcript_43875/g.72476 Transcript_43875/m.72476 type:complete len:201 (+) Transcript_43875:30-632(+)|eukprot:CAMPEP_0202689652 /NCGR_PEP_ID=MMETSP1385-20130828/4859_1 /ASSEMBLY_ACC=CAM_ASM_000861 /TAXON_ID=933848 /ORGANISM="Elphidium margaritaceum" /LENGTH=200 /DNA_ID=CAMNT_0049344807 /DNA_START=27 /DNA_END=629 /DNA_ORIENTATION=+
MAAPSKPTPGSDIDVKERVTIRYGSRIVIEHVNTQYRLHSHFITYPVGSKQQQVTCFSNHDSNDWWIVKPSHNHQDSLKLWQAEVQNGDVIQLQHYQTGLYLHSHANVQSAVSKQGEVTCYPGHNTDNNWKLTLKGDTESECWQRGKKINLVHCNTNQTLHSHNQQLPDWAHKQQEVTTYSQRDTNDDWFVSKVEKHQWF